MSSSKNVVRSNDPDLVNKYRGEWLSGNTELNDLLGNYDKEEVTALLSQYVKVFKAMMNKDLKSADSHRIAFAYVSDFLGRGIPSEAAVPIMGRGDGKDTKSPSFYRGDGGYVDASDLSEDNMVYFAAEETKKIAFDVITKMVSKNLVPKVAVMPNESDEDVSLDFGGSDDESLELGKEPVVEDSKLPAVGGVDTPL